VYPLEDPLTTPPHPLETLAESAALETRLGSAVELKELPPTKTTNEGSVSLR